MTDDPREQRAPRPKRAHRSPQSPVVRSRSQGGGLDGRIRLLRVLVIAFLVLIGGRAVALASSSDLTRLAQRQQTRTITLPAHRGAIVDRHGRELAVGTPQQTVYATPKLLDDPVEAAGQLCDALKIKDKKQRRAVAEALSDRTKGFAFVARKVDPDLAKAAKALDLPGVGSYTEEERTYPLKGSAAQLIGIAGIDNNGLAGIELQYDKDLAGKAGTQVAMCDPTGRALRTLEQTDPVPGANVQLTLDADIQYTAEDVLTKTLRSSMAKGAVAVVMNPKTGEILAMVNVPILKDHVFVKSGYKNRNRVVTDIYDPGSIFKMVTISGALADGVVKPTSKFTLQSSIQVADREINESHERGTVTYSVAQILQWSSNVGAVRIAQRMGEGELYKWVTAFNFGKPTGLHYPGETAGIVLPLEQWSGSSIGNIPMGQGVSVTPLQMAAAVCAIANDGVYVAPKLVAQIGDNPTAAAKTSRIIPAKVASQVRTMLTKAVDAGTGTKGRIKGYRVAGKTGTSQKALTGGKGYSRINYIASFAAMVPADDPRLVVLVAVDQPRTSIYGGDIAAPAVQQIMSFAIQHLEIAP